MKPEPLRKKIKVIEINWEKKTLKIYRNPILKAEINKDGFIETDDIKSAVEGLIKFHEDRIEAHINLIKRDSTIDLAVAMLIIQNEYESIMAIEHWLEDVI